MSKKKLATLALLVCFGATAVAGASLAYFTDTDEATNVFTVGGVEIELIEKGVNAAGETVDFAKLEADDKVLMPGKENAVMKEVSITNTGKSDAYVWYVWAIPTALDSTDKSTGTNNILHVNSYGRTWDTYRNDSKYWEDGQTAALLEDQTWDHDPEKELNIPEYVGPEGFLKKGYIFDEDFGNFGTGSFDDCEYNYYVTLYHGVVKPGETTEPGMSQVYLDKGVDYDGVNDKYVDKDGNTINYDLSHELPIYVTAYGIQADLADIDGDNEVTVYDAYKAFIAQE